MAETLVENPVCSACGAEVRAGALFCYNCGGAVASEIVVAKSERNAAIKNAQVQEILHEENAGGDGFKHSEIKLKQKDKKIPAEKVTETPAAKSALPEVTKLKTAAAMRGKSKLIQPKKVEVIWEERENAPNVWFILVAVGLTVFAAGILFLAIWLK